MDAPFWLLYGEAVETSVGFFWKSGWAFVLGYFISAMIQAFVPKGKLTPYIGNPRPKSLALATLFGTISSSCSFAALATARSLLLKGAHFVAAVAFMFASTNLVIELGILILIFLGWQFLAAEVIGGLLLIAISSILIVLTYPEKWLQASREKVEKEAEAEEGDFDWRERIKRRKGWLLVGHLFVMEWKMVWREILIGFTVAGFVAVLVPRGLWQFIFLADMVSNTSGLNFWIVLENSLLAPFVAAATFIGSMGNIPLATVLNANGVLFAGIMGFIYSDLMVPPLVAVNAKYYGWKTAIYIAIIMYVSIVLAAITLHYAFAILDIMPTSARKVEEVAQFKLDYSFWMNIFAALLTGILIYSHHRYLKIKKMKMKKGSEGLSLKKISTYIFVLILIGGFCTFLLN
jgi:uncharacterized membrane protein YraQ (UPF0718 family)